MLDELGICIVYDVLDKGPKNAKAGDHRPMLRHEGVNPERSGKEVMQVVEVLSAPSDIHFRKVLTNFSHSYTPRQIELLKFT